MSTVTEVRTFSDICKVSDCVHPRHFINGYCRKHYSYNKIHGYPVIKQDIVKRLPLTKANAQWLAGVFDCEGWLGTTTSHNTYSIKAGVGMATPILVRYLLKLTGIGKVMKRVVKNERAKTQYHWVIWRALDVKRLCATIKPYLILKVKQAEILLNFPALHSKNVCYRKASYIALRKLNKRGR